MAGPSVLMSCTSTTELMRVLQDGEFFVVKMMNSKSMTKRAEDEVRISACIVQRFLELLASIMPIIYSHQALASLCRRW